MTIILNNKKDWDIMRRIPIAVLDETLVLVSKGKGGHSIRVVLFPLGRFWFTEKYPGNSDDDFQFKIVKGIGELYPESGMGDVFLWNDEGDVEFNMENLFEYRITEVCHKYDNRGE